MKTLDDALRDGCEVEQLHVKFRNGAWMVLINSMWQSLDSPHAFVVAYVASLLRDKVLGNDSQGVTPVYFAQYLDALSPDVKGRPGRLLMSDNMHILAALVALGHWTLEEAREALKT